MGDKKDTPGAPPLSDEELSAPDPDDPGEVSTIFPTIGKGWSGRDQDEDDDDD